MPRFKFKLSGRSSLPDTPDQDTEEFVNDVLERTKSFVSRKRQREHEDIQEKTQGLEEEIVHLKGQLTASLVSCETAKLRKAEAVQTSNNLQAEKELLEKKVEEHTHAINTLEKAVEPTEEENKNLEAELERLRKYEILWKETASKFNTISCKSRNSQY